MKIIFTYIALTIIAFQSIAQQQKRVLIYASGSDILIPLIESQLSNLRDTINNLPLFSSISNLNRINLLKSSENLTRSTIDYYANDIYIEESSKIDSLRVAIGKELIDNDIFLLFRINQISSFIEVQISKYELVPIDAKTQIKPNAVQIGKSLELKHTEDILISLEDSLLTNKIHDALYRTFPMTNYFPKAIISSESQVIEQDIFESIGETINLNGSMSTDQETPQEQLHYKWNVHSKGSELNYYTSSSTSGKSFAVKFLKSGEYKITLKVFDNVHQSHESSININVAPKPRLGAIPFFVNQNPSLLMNQNRTQILLYDSLNSNLRNSKITIGRTQPPPITKHQLFHALGARNSNNRNKGLSEYLSPSIKITDRKDSLGSTLLFIRFRSPQNHHNDSIALKFYTDSSRDANIKIPILLPPLPLLSLRAGLGFSSISGIKRIGTSNDTISQNSSVFSLGANARLLPFLELQFENQFLSNGIDSLVESHTSVGILYLTNTSYRNRASTVSFGPMYFNTITKYKDFEDPGKYLSLQALGGQLSFTTHYRLGSQSIISAFFKTQFGFYFKNKLISDATFVSALFGIGIGAN